MSNSELYHMQRIVGWNQVGQIEYTGHDVIYHLEPQKRLVCCPCCGNTDVRTKGSVERKLRGVPVGHVKNVFFNIRIPRINCPECGAVRQIVTEIAREKRKYTKAFEKEVILRVMDAPLDKVAHALGVDWHTINSILQDYLKKKYSDIDLKGLRYIAIDEICIGKGHKYLTIVLNLETGDPVFVGDGKSEEALQPFWKLLGRRAKGIKVVCLDMGPAFQKAVREHLPEAKIVFDRFHVVKLMNERLDQLRRSEFAKADKETRGVLKGSRFLLLKNEDNLDEGRDEIERLKRALALNTVLTTAYILKESLRQIWQKDSKEEASANLEGWVKSAAASEIPQLGTMARTIDRHSEGILNFYDHRMSSGPIEGFNNKVKVLIRRAYGYRNMGNLKLMMLGINEFDPRRIFG